MGEERSAKKHRACGAADKRKLEYASNQYDEPFVFDVQTELDAELVEVCRNFLLLCMCLCACVRGRRSRRCAKDRRATSNSCAKR